MFKNVASQKVAVFAWNAATGAAKTGDAANITAKISKDGGSCAATNDTNPTELSATDAPGVYVFDMTQAETNADLVIVSASSATSNIQIRPVIIYTVATVSDIQAVVEGASVEGAYTFQDALAVLLAFAAGKATGGGSTPIKFRNQADSVDRLTQTVDAVGNRSATVIDVTDL